MIGKFGRIVATAALAASAGSTLFGGTAFATGNNHHNDEGGEGGKGGKNSAKCAAPVGLSVGGLASSGGEVDQCNSNGGDGGRGGAGDVDF